MSKANKRNRTSRFYRKYENKQEDILIIKGTSSLVDDVKKLYIEEFEEAKEEYNSKQTRENRKIKL